MRRSELKRSSGLSARGKGGACPPKPSGAERNGIGTPKRVVPGYDGVEWQRRVIESYTDPFTFLSGWVACEWCLWTGRDLRPAEEAHHLLTKQVLRRELDLGVYEVAVMDPRNGMPLCKACHAAHHSRQSPVCRYALRDEAFEFAREHKLLEILNRTYPYPGVQA